MSQIPSLDHLIHELTKLPGIGEKTAQRLAYFVLKAGGEYQNSLKQALEAVQTHVRECSRCFAYTEESAECRICSASDRDDHILCVVEEASDIFRVEHSGVFHGRYHVLQGALAPLEGVGPEDLRLKELVERVEAGQRGEAPEIRELVLALDADLEGDTTALYISKLLGTKGVRLTRIAYGVPFGSDIDFVDRRTLGRALENRVEL